MYVKQDLPSSNSRTVFNCTFTVFFFVTCLTNKKSGLVFVIIDSKLLEALKTSIFIQYASVIPFRKPLGVLMKLCRIGLTSEAIRGRQRPLKMKKRGLITFFEEVLRTPNFKLKPSELVVGDP